MPKRSIKLMPRIYQIFFFGWLISCIHLNSLSIYAITAEIRNLSDHTVTSILDFGSFNTTQVYTQSNQYMVIRYDPLDPDAQSLKIFSNNPNWVGTTPQSGGLVLLPNHSQLLPLFWKAYGTPQTNIILNNQSEPSFHSLADQNAPGFSTYPSTDLSIPLFGTGETYIYFGAKTNTTNPSGAYGALIRVKNDATPVTTNTVSMESGFGNFDHRLLRTEGKDLNILINVDKPDRTELTVFDRTGTRIKTLLLKDNISGAQSISWDGKSEDGKQVSSGVYYLVLKIGSKIHKSKIAVLN